MQRVQVLQYQFLALHQPHHHLSLDHCRHHCRHPLLDFYHCQFRPHFLLDYCFHLHRHRRHHLHRLHLQFLLLACYEMYWLQCHQHPPPLRLPQKHRHHRPRRLHRRRHHRRYQHLHHRHSRLVLHHHHYRLVLHHHPLRRLPPLLHSLLDSHLQSRTCYSCGMLALVDSVDYIMGGRILVFLRGDMYIRDGSCSGIRKLVRAGGVGRGLIRQGKEKARALGSNCST
mmetsp:Transcript_15990/g.23403  ORF Transcript_15990/g.23403 Transcript_15990/m.23403 type:complete len:227 (+) Transcript_15990:3068-3748(+)